MKIKITERGWAGHFCESNNCRYRRNTLIEYGKNRVVVSSVGALYHEDKLKEIGYKRYYETKAFIAVERGYYWEVDVNRLVKINQRCGIKSKESYLVSADADYVADVMHDKIVKEVFKKLQKDRIEIYCQKCDGYYPASNKSNNTCLSCLIDKGV